MKSWQNHRDKFLNHQPLKDKNDHKSHSSATPHAFSFSNILHVYPPLDLLYYKKWSARPSFYNPHCQPKNKHPQLNLPTFFYNPNSNASLSPNVTSMQVINNNQAKNKEKNLAVISYLLIYNKNMNWYGNITRSTLKKKPLQRESLKIAKPNITHV